MTYITAVFALLLVLLSVLFLPQLFTSLHAVQVDTTTESADITTGGVTTGNLTLSEELHRAAISSVLSLESTNSNDVPFTVYYDEDTQVLGVDGLQAGASRILSAEYEYVNPDNNPGMGAVATFLGILFVLCLMILLVVIPSGTLADLWRRFR